MTTLMPDALATSADYADAMLVARRAKNWLFLILLLILLLQLTLFFVARYTGFLAPHPQTTQPTTTDQKLQYVTSLTTFLGTILPILLSLDLLLILNIMLVGRLIGLARVTSAFMWCLLLVLLLFPWQVFFGGTTEPTDFRLPGLLFSWQELLLYARFPTDDLKLATLKWARFVVFPVIALVLLLIVQVKSNRGLRQALGEAEPETHM